MKVKFKDKEVEGKEIDVLLSNEKWNEYQLSDGNILMFKEVLISVVKVIGEQNPDGTPAYIFQTHKVTRIKEGRND